MTQKTAEGWDATTVSVDALLESGVTVRLHGVPAKKHKKTGRVVIDPDDIAKAQFRDIATEVGLKEERDAATLALLAAPAGNLPAQYVQYKYSMNKMLFYQWKKLEEQGLGEAFPHDTFVQERKGPVPENLDGDLTRLEHEGLVKVKRPTGTQHAPMVIELTPKGKLVAENVLSKADTWFREMTIGVKGDIFPLSPDKLKARVHSEYPEYTRKWVEVDAE